MRLASSLNGMSLDSGQQAEPILFGAVVSGVNINALADR
jgi:hypothetical protein